MRLGTTAPGSISDSVTIGCIIIAVAGIDERKREEIWALVHHVWGGREP